MADVAKAPSDAGQPALPDLGVTERSHPSGRAQQEGVPTQELAGRYIDAYFREMDALNVKRAHVYPMVTQEVPRMVDMVRALVDKGYGYVVGNNVYYDVTKFENYGKLSGNTLEELNAGARIKVNEEKRNPRDFALWKHDQRHIQQWDSPWDRGFPGWHIECSAMSSKYLGVEFDFHTGGEDNIFPHHECEIAQSEAASGRKFVHYWMHTRFLMFDGEKMSKSKGNLYTIDELIEKGFRKNAIRYVLISSHYRQNYNFTFEGLKAAEQAIDKIGQCIFSLSDRIEAGDNSPVSENVKKLTEKAIEGFDGALCDDLNISKALASVFDFIKEVNKLDNISSADAEDIIETIEKIDTVLGVLEKKTVDIPPEIIELAEQRKEAKLSRNWQKADDIREQLSAKGYIIEDIAGQDYRIKHKGT